MYVAMNTVDPVVVHYLQMSVHAISRLQKFANSRWRTDAILKIIFGYNSSPYCPIEMKFGVRRYNRTHSVR